MPRKKSNTGQEAPAHDTRQTAVDIPAKEQDGPLLPDEEDFLVDFSKVVEQMQARQADRDNAEQTDIPVVPGAEDKAEAKSASEQEKPRQCRTPKDKPIPEAEKPKRNGRPPKAEKSVQEQAEAQRDKVSTSEKDKTNLFVPLPPLFFPCSGSSYGSKMIVQPLRKVYRYHPTQILLYSKQ